MKGDHALQEKGAIFEKCEINTWKEGYDVQYTISYTFPLHSGLREFPKTEVTPNHLLHTSKHNFTNTQRVEVTKVLKGLTKEVQFFMFLTSWKGFKILPLVLK